MSKIKTIILTVLALSAGFMFSACKIEPLEDDEPIVLSGYVKADTDNNGTYTAVPYIVVELISSSSISNYRNITLTDSNGWFEFKDLPSGVTWKLRITDTDPENEVSFNQQILTITRLKESYCYDGIDEEPIKLTVKNNS